MGHGTLIRNKEVYIEKLLELMKDLNNHLPIFGDFLCEKGLSLLDKNGHYLTGPNYFSSIKGENWNVKASCCGKYNNNNTPTMIISGRSFSGPDIFFLDSYFYSKNSRGSVVAYRNFSKNKHKYFTPGGKIFWDFDVYQTGWLNPSERKEWYVFFENSLRKGKHENSLREVLLEAAEQFQSRGMHANTKHCLDLLEKYKVKLSIKQDEELGLLIVKYSLESSLGYEEKAENCLKETQKQLDRIAPLKLKKYYAIKLKIIESWHKGVSGRNEALNLLSSVLKDLERLRTDFPLYAYLYELEARKNKLYLCKRLPEGEVRLNSQNLKEDCLSLFAMASKLSTLSISRGIRADRGLDRRKEKPLLLIIKS